MSYFNSKNIFGFISLFCVGLFLSSLVLQYFVFVVPCPLCIVQRYTYLIIGILSFLIYSSSSPVSFMRVRLYSGVLSALTIFGGSIATRQVWLQHHPSPIDSTKCAVTFGSFFDSVLTALGGVGSCMRVDFTFLTLSLAEWSVLCFLSIFCVLLLLFFRFFSQNEEII